MLRFSLASSLRLFAGGHRGVVTPVPIPNTEVKGSFAEGSAGLARARVGRRRLFYFLRRVCLHSSNGKPASPIGRTPARASPIGRTPARASPSATHCVRGIFRLFSFHSRGIRLRMPFRFSGKRMLPLFATKSTFYRLRPAFYLLW